VLEKETADSVGGWEAEKTSFDPIGLVTVLWAGNSPHLPDWAANITIKKIIKL